ncbi:hypothetical protein SAMN05216207_1006165 [Pseudonocardia ammonioxydans]|uniref:Tetratricopeptide repeat-containing protein n=1 Tax=Pseudonocardia ammonioxydans TaxID=260086 RepID=A0A1I4VMD8_PSUAM|nr:hypothetical protein SAMN05216207_1006165 [Pseudonocardia ammonioxydans]
MTDSTATDPTPPDPTSIDSTPPASTATGSTASDPAATGPAATDPAATDAATTDPNPPVADPDPVLAEITAAVEAGRGGERVAARERFAALWERITGAGDPFHRCVLAHYAADVQDDPLEELRWDGRALAAADEVTDERVRAHHASLQIAGFYPSLHLNLADVHRRLGHDAEAGRQLELARQRSDALGDDGYGHMIRSAIERCGQRLERGDRSGDS